MSTPLRWFAPCLFLVLAGCGGSSEVPQAPVESNIQKLAVLYGRYMARNAGKSPASAEELKKFAEGPGASEVASLEVTDVAALFVSPRDNQPYVVVPTPAKSGPPGMGGDPIVIYEQTGVGGKRFVAYALGKYREVDEAEFNQIKPK